MLNVEIAGDHLYGKQLFTWLSLVMSLMASFCAVLFCDVLDEICDLIESVSDSFPTYSYRIYDVVKAKTRKSHASIQII